MTGRIWTLDLQTFFYWRQGEQFSPPRCPGKGSHPDFPAVCRTLHRIATTAKEPCACSLTLRRDVPRLEEEPICPQRAQHIQLRCQTGPNNLEELSSAWGYMNDTEMLEHRVWSLLLSLSLLPPRAYSLQQASPARIRQILGTDSWFARTCCITIIASAIHSLPGTTLRS